MILSLGHVSKSFLDQEIIKDATFQIAEKEKAALVGSNGAGKTTIFRMITGELEPDSGSIVLSGRIVPGYLPQNAETDSPNSVYDELISVRSDLFDVEKEMRGLETRIASGEENSQALLARHSELHDLFEKENGYALESEVTGILKGLGFPESDFDKPVRVLSGGEKTRVALGKLLLRKPELLLLDEPTNHLDLKAIGWLESYLKTYPGAVLLISHDRYFIDKLCTKIIDLSFGVTDVYRGNYTEYAAKKNAKLIQQARDYEKQQKEIKRQEEIIDRFYRYGTERQIKKAKSREKLLSHVERLEKPVEENNEMRLKLTPAIESGNDVLSVRGLSKSYGSRLLFKDVEFEVHKKDRIAIIGDNGAGKTTLLRMIMGEESPDSGEIRYGTNVYAGYFDQEHAGLSPEKTLFQELSDTYPDMDNTKIRNTLAAFLFTGDDVFKQIHSLSGGEQGRLALAKLMLSNANLLILDEPTNHLDMVSCEILERALTSYEGTIITVSHDRYFINAVADGILELYDQQFLKYQGGYDYYLEKEELFHEQAQKGREASSVSKSGTSQEDWLRRKEESAKKRKSEQDLKKTEDEIARLEEKLSALEQEMALPENASDADKLIKLHQEEQETQEILSDLYVKWEEQMG